MIAATRYNKGAGNAAVAVRLRGALGTFWNFVTLAWVTQEVANCRVLLQEVQDSDQAESLYVADVAVPLGGPWILEAVLVSTGDFLGSEATPADVPAAGATLVEIEASTVLAKEASLTAIQEAQADLATGINQLLTNTEILLDAGQGKWEIVGNQMIFYRRNGSELMRFDLQDANGAPSMTAVYKRVPVA